MKTTNLEKWLYLVRRIEEHREEKAVRDLQKLYRSLIKDLRKVMGNKDDRVPFFSDPLHMLIELFSSFL